MAVCGSRISQELFPDAHVNASGLSARLPTALSRSVYHLSHLTATGASQVALVINSPLASAQDVRTTVSIPGSGRSPGEGHGYPLQCSCLESPMDRGAWWATVHRVTESQTRLKRLSAHTQIWNRGTKSLRG